MRTNETLYQTIVKRPKLWLKSNDMIIIRKHSYINDKEIRIIGHHFVAGLHTIHFENEIGKNIHFYAKRKHIMFTRNPEGKLVPTTIYTGIVLQK